jgi:Arc/MetJ-type ribon-helix-helix transcriptional regulator
MARRAQDASQIVSVRLPNELLRRLDRYLDWRETARRGTSSRNAAIREALHTWLDEQEPLAGLVSPETLRRQFQAAYDRVSPSQDWVPIHRLRQQLQWPAERFDAVVEGLRAERQVELERAEPGARGADVHASYAVHGHLYVRLRWCD